MAIGPGVDSAMAVSSTRSLSVSHFLLSTTSPFNRDKVTAPPPKVKTPSFIKTRNNFTKSRKV